MLPTIKLNQYAKESNKLATLFFKFAINCSLKSLSLHKNTAQSAKQWLCGGERSHDTQHNDNQHNETQLMRLTCDTQHKHSA